MGSKEEVDSESDCQTKLVHFNEPFELEFGNVLPGVTVAYEAYGKLNDEGTNAVLVCHALSGDAHASDYYHKENAPGKVTANRHKGWWNGLISVGKSFDPTEYFVICSNILGSCYGTTGPTSLNPATCKRYAMDFPIITVRDMVKLQRQLIDYLGVKKLRVVTGGSLGGMQVLEWALMYPELVEKIIPIATAVKHSAWCIGLNEIARKAILDDPAYNNGYYTEQPRAGLSTARMIAMISYRSAASFQQKFGREVIPNKFPTAKTCEELYQVESYLYYQGEKFVDRFDANTYFYITRALDSHDVTRNRGTMREVLGSIKAKTLCMGISSDILYPVEEQKEIASLIPGSEYFEIDSIAGHDAFLIEFEQMDTAIKKFMSGI
jgi:homoserine O-acetyltransferase/O-succinyltransferase